MLGVRKWLSQSALIPSYTDSPTERTHVLGGRLRKICKQPRLFYLGAIVIGLTFILSSVFVNEQSSKASLLDRLSVPFKTGGCYLTKTHCRRGGEALPRGIIVDTTDLQFRSLAIQEENEVQENLAKNLLAMAVGIKQKKVVDEIVQKFPLSNFTIMLFHYDGIVDQWHDLSWSNQSIHIVALHQTKWWYAKRFMHPDIVAQYNYIFLWDEDLGVENFHANKYLQIMEAEGLEISQPALDPTSQDIHHGITRRQPAKRAHKNFLKYRGSTICTPESNGPPCTGFVEVMAPVFSKAAWRCIWYMIQNDLVHGWGIDFKIGYCAQGLRSEKVGVIDAEYVLHKGIPSLGGPHVNKAYKRKGVRFGWTNPNMYRSWNKTLVAEMSTALENSSTNASESVYDLRAEVRKRSGSEMLSFLRRWRKAASEDPTWKDPYKRLNDSSGSYHMKSPTKLWDPNGGVKVEDTRSIHKKTMLKDNLAKVDHSSKLGERLRKSHYDDFVDD